MKRLLRHFIIDTYSLWQINKLAEGLVFENGWKTLFIAGAAVMAISLLAKPVINLLLLPLNLVTFGVFRWVSSAVVIFIVSLIIPSFKVTGFFYPGFSSPWIDIPSIHLTGLTSYIGFSFLLSLYTSFIYWLVK